MSALRDPARGKAARLDPEHRRIPAQDRSRLRLERILDAAAQVFADVGYEAATTETIAEKAETSVGSIYQFFPNKRALFNAIAMRYLDRCRGLFEGLLSSASPSSASWEELLDRSVDVFAAVNNEPGFRAVWKNWQVSSDIFAAGDALNREFARRLEALLAAYAPGIPVRRRPLVATVIVEVMSALLLLAVRRERAMNDEIVRETKTLLRHYLAPYAAATSRPRRGRARP